MSSKRSSLTDIVRSALSFFWNLPKKLLELLFRTLFRKLLDRFSRSATTVDSTVPFLTRTVLPDDYPTGVDMDIDRFDGLLALQISRGKTAPQALAMWRSQDHFAKSKSQFETLLKSSVTESGLLLQFLLPTRSWFKRLTIPVIYGTIVTAVAVFATVEALRNDYSWLFGTPKIDFSDPGKEHDFLIYQPIVLDYPITNTGRSNARIELTETSVRPLDDLTSADGLELPTHVPAVRALEPNKTDVFPIRARGIKPGRYEIRYAGRLSNEWLRNERWEGLTYKIRIWPECRVLLDS